MSEDTVYAIAGGKGGVGKTTVAANLAVAISELGIGSVAVVDVDLGMANLAQFFGETPSGPTLNDVLAQEAAVEEALYELSEDLTLLPGASALDSYVETDTDHLKTVVARLRERFDFVLLDLGAGISYETVLPLEIVDAVILVTAPDQAAIDNTRTTAAIVSRAGSTPGGVVVNQHRPGESTPPASVAAELNLQLLGSVPEDDAVRDALEAGQPVFLSAPDSPAANAFGDLAGAVVPNSLVDEIEQAEADRSRDADAAPAVAAAGDGSFETVLELDGDEAEQEPPSPSTPEAPPTDGTAEEKQDDSGGFLSWLLP